MAVMSTAGDEALLPGAILTAKRPTQRTLPARTRHELLSVDELAEVTAAYQLFDSAGTGSLDYRQLRCCLRALGFAMDAAQLGAFAAEFDREQTGRVSFAAVQEIAGRAYADTPAERRLADAFALFDADGAGRIGRRELKRACRDAGLLVGDDELGLMIDEFDADHDGAIGLDDFRAVLAEAMLGGF